MKETIMLTVSTIMHANVLFELHNDNQAMLLLPTENKTLLT